MTSAKQSEKDSKSSGKPAVTRQADNSRINQETPRQNRTANNESVTSSRITTSNPNTGNSALSGVATGEQIKWQVISGGGGSASSSSYMLTGTIGQPVVGHSNSASYAVNAGFWQNFSTSGGCCIGDRGNVNGDAMDAVDISDVIYLVDYSFGTGPAPTCIDEADVNGDGTLDISDLVYLVDYSFGSGPPPVACP